MHLPKKKRLNFEDNQIKPILTPAHGSQFCSTLTSTFFSTNSFHFWFTKIDVSIACFSFIFVEIVSNVSLLISYTLATEWSLKLILLHLFKWNESDLIVSRVEYELANMRQVPCQTRCCSRGSIEWLNAHRTLQKLYCTIITCQLDWSRLTRLKLANQFVSRKSIRLIELTL